MLDFHAASDRAVRQAIQTGHMPNMYLIHELQRGEGYEPCFGRATEPCPRSHCRFHQSCMALYEFDGAGRTKIDSPSSGKTTPKSVPLSVLGLPDLPPEEGEKVIPIKPIKRDVTAASI